MLSLSVKRIIFVQAFSNDSRSSAKVGDDDTSRCLEEEFHLGRRLHQICFYLELVGVGGETFSDWDLLYIFSLVDNGQVLSTVSNLSKSMKA